MSDPLRRRVCRIVFLLICILPTAIALKWILTPPTITQWESQLKNQTGLAANVRDVKTPLPQETVLDGVQLTVSEETDPVELGAVTISNTERLKLIFVQSFKTTNNGLAEIAERLYRQVSEPPFPVRPFRVVVGQAQIAAENINGSPIVQPIHGLTIDVQATDSNFEATIKFRLKVAEDAPVVQITYTRLMHAAPQETWTVLSQQTDLPTWMLAEIIPQLKCLGTAALFEGSIRLTRSDQQWDGTVSGDLRNVDLYHLVQVPFKQTALGSLNMRIRDCQFVDGRVEILDGTVTSTGGQLSKELLNSFAENFSLGMPPFGDQQFALDYGSMQFDFKIQHELINFNGDQHGTLLYAPNRDQILLTNQSSWFPVSWLVKALGGKSEPSVPLSTRSLSRYLRMPAEDQAGSSEVPFISEGNRSPTQTFFQ